MEKYLRSRDGSIEDYNLTFNDLFPEISNVDEE